MLPEAAFIRDRFESWSCQSQGLVDPVKRAGKFVLSSFGLVAVRKGSHHARETSVISSPPAGIE